MQLCKENVDFFYSSAVSIVVVFGVVCQCFSSFFLVLLLGGLWLQFIWLEVSWVFYIVIYFLFPATSSIAMNTNPLENLKESHSTLENPGRKPKKTQTKTKENLENLKKTLEPPRKNLQKESLQSTPQAIPSTRPIRGKAFEKTVESPSEKS